MRRSWWIVASLALLGCRTESPEPAARAAGGEQGDRQLSAPGPFNTRLPLGPPPGESWEFVEERGPRPEPAPAPSIELRAKRIQVGMRRGEFIEAMAGCERRVGFVPPGAGSVVLEVFQPEGEECLRHFGARQFVFKVGKLAQIEEGLRKVPPEAG